MEDDYRSTGTITNLLEIYTSPLKGTGSFSFYRDLGNGKKIYGKLQRQKAH